MNEESGGNGIGFVRNDIKEKVVLVCWIWLLLLGTEVSGKRMMFCNWESREETNEPSPGEVVPKPTRRSEAKEFTSYAWEE
jgi:hypothetical protein